MNDRSDWQIVQNAPPPTARCAISGFGDGPFVDFRCHITGLDPNVAINVDVLKDAARFVGMVNPEDYADALAKIAALEGELDRLVDEMHDLEQFKQSVDTIVSLDYVARKKPGRKPAEKVAA